jgi:hypothetical protein
VTNVERARELKVVLDSVETNAQARAVADAAVGKAREACTTLAGPSSWGVIAEISGDIARVTKREESFPSDDAPVGDAWGGPSGLRVAIQALTAHIWAIEKVFPAGTSWADDAGTFADGFVSTLAWELGKLRDGASAAAGIVAPVLWPVAAVVALLAVIFVVVKARAA